MEDKDGSDAEYWSVHGWSLGALQRRAALIWRRLW